MDIKAITEKLIEFRNDRGWGKHHTGPELARSLTIEATELNRLFQWGNEPSTVGEYNNLEEELADIMIYCIYMFHKYGINPETAINEKIAKNAIKYPVPSEAVK